MKNSLNRLAILTLALVSISGESVLAQGRVDRGATIFAIAPVSKNIDRNQAVDPIGFPISRSIDIEIENELIKTGDQYLSEGQQTKAVEYFAQALSFFQSKSDLSGQTVALFRLGGVYSAMGQFKFAIGHYEKALEINTARNKQSDIAFALMKIGYAYLDSGDYDKAFDYCERSLVKWREIKDRFREAEVVNYFGIAYDDLGQYQKAIENFDLAISIMRAEDPDYIADFLTNLGITYKKLGSYKKAVELMEQGLVLQRKFKFNLNWSLLNLADLYSQIGQLDKADALYTEIMPELRKRNQGTFLAIALNGQGTLFAKQKKYQQAIVLHNQALDLTKERKLPIWEADSLYNLGLDHLAQSSFEIAGLYFEQALAAYRKLKRRGGEANALSGLMQTWSQRKQKPLAITYGKQSINILQSTRTEIRALDKKVQSEFLKDNERTYRYLADLLISQGRVAEAEEVLAMLKEDELFGYLRRNDSVVADVKSRISLSTEEKKAFDDYEQFAGDVTRFAEGFGELERKRVALPLGESLSAADQKQHAELKQKYDASVVVFNAFLNDLRVKFGSNDKRVANVESDTQGILKRLGEPKTVIISTIVGEEHLNLIVTTADIQRAHTVNIKAVDLNKLVSDFREAVRDPNVDPRPLGKRLYDTLFPAALQKDLDGIRADTIVWSLDGTLRYVPMASLWDGKQYLVERYTSAVLTLASRDKLTAAVTDRTKWQALGVGVSKEYQTFPALSAVPQELCSVISDPKKKDFCASVGKQKSGVIRGMMLPDEEFTLQSFENNIGKAPVVHIASHFSLNAGNESDSYLLLGGGTDRKFSIANLRKTRLDKLELLTLSACNTAMTSGANSSGVEIEGFGALAQNQGAKTILATLWAVADDSTRDLMTEFYRNLETDPKLGRADALRRSQLALLNGSYKPGEPSLWRRAELAGPAANNTRQPKFATDPNSPYAHPYYWAPFVLIGNWR